MFNVSYCTVGQGFHNFSWNSLYKNQELTDRKSNQLSALARYFKNVFVFCILKKNVAETSNYFCS